MISAASTSQAGASTQSSPWSSKQLSSDLGALPSRPFIPAAPAHSLVANQHWRAPQSTSKTAQYREAPNINQMFVAPPVSAKQSIHQPFPQLPPRPSFSPYANSQVFASAATLPGPSRSFLQIPVSTGLGKRKQCPAADDISEVDSSSTTSDRSSNDEDAAKAVIRSATALSDRKPNLPVPVLPIPLPSKRYKKNLKSRGTLIPAEQLPTYPLPPLPTINDPELAKQVFTHSSLFSRPKGRFEDPEDAPTKHYEKLEHVGDSILGMVVTTWLHEIKPRLTCGAATKLKAHLVSNATLSHLSGNYNFPQRLNGDPELLPVLRASTDVRAAMVEAYIAALYFSYPPEERTTVALRVIDGWLREMYEPLMDFFYEYMSKENEQHRLACEAGIDGTVILLSEEEMEKIDAAAVGMSNLITMYCNKQDRELAWEYERFETNIGALWKVKCVVDGIELGDATRANKKQAKNVAAWEGAKKLGVTPA